MKICFIYTGGTIGCCGQPLTPLTTEVFKQAFTDNVAPMLSTQFSDCKIDMIGFAPPLDSTNLQPADWCAVAKDILNYYSDYEAFIILHGTDSMAWTASALSFLLTGLDAQGRVNAKLSKPVIMTGAQLPLFRQTLDSDGQASYAILAGTDAIDNVCRSVAAAYTGIAGVMLCFGKTLLRGSRVLKTSVSEFEAFSSPNYPVLGQYDDVLLLNNNGLAKEEVSVDHALENPCVKTRQIEQLNYISGTIDKVNVLPFSAYPANCDSTSVSGGSVIADMLQACITQGVNGIILASYGDGNFPSGHLAMPEQGAVYKVLRQAHEQGIVLVNCTQVLRGAVNPDSYAAGSWLSRVGVVGVYDMTPVSALCKLIYLLALRGFENNGWGQQTIERLMMSNMVDELTES